MFEHQRRKITLSTKIQKIMQFNGLKKNNVVILLIL